MSDFDWPQRYRQQSTWTADLRAYLIQRSGLSTARRILEVGCGAGAITSSLHPSTSGQIFGLDISLPVLRQARAVDRASFFTCADAMRLPYPEAQFDGVVCHFFLLWASSPKLALAEMRRVCKPGGVVLAFAEPDYGARIDFPPALEEIGRLQSESLTRQGADPLIGRQLSALFHQAGLVNVETGLLGGQWNRPPDTACLELEWKVLASDLGDSVLHARLSELRQLDSQAWANGERVLFVPTFYAWGRVP